MVVASVVFVNFHYYKEVEMAEAKKSKPAAKKAMTVKKVVAKKAVAAKKPVAKRLQSRNRWPRRLLPKKR